jgi:hypothetical protein
MMMVSPLVVLKYKAGADESLVDSRWYGVVVNEKSEWVETAVVQPLPTNHGDLEIGDYQFLQ